MSADRYETIRDGESEPRDGSFIPQGLHVHLFLTQSVQRLAIHGLKLIPEGACHVEIGQRAGCGEPKGPLVAAMLQMLSPT